MDEFYTLQVAGLTRKLPVCRLNEKMSIAAFIMLYGFFAYKFWMLYRKEKAMAKLSYGMIGLLIMIGIQAEGLTDTNLTQVPIMREFWFLMGLLFAAGKMELEERNQHEV